MAPTAASFSMIFPIGVCSNRKVSLIAGSASLSCGYAFTRSDILFFCKLLLSIRRPYLKQRNPLK